MYYQIFCKWHQQWFEYEFKEDRDELEVSMYHGMFLCCHLCNNYYIHIDSVRGVVDSFRDGYDSNLTDEQRNAKPLFTFTAKSELPGVYHVPKENWRP